MRCLYLRFNGHVQNSHTFVFTYISSFSTYLIFIAVVKSTWLSQSPESPTWNPLHPSSHSYIIRFFSYLLLINTFSIHAFFYISILISLVQIPLFYKHPRICPFLSQGKGQISHADKHRKNFQTIDSSIRCLCWIKLCTFSVYLLNCRQLSVRDF